MSNWFYVGMAYGVTYVGLIGYTIHLLRSHSRAAAALRAEPHKRED
jgi:heme exporter protein D